MYHRKIGIKLGIAHKTVTSFLSRLAEHDPQKVLWVFGCQNKEEKYMSKNIQGKTRDGSLSQII